MARLDINKDLYTDLKNIVKENRIEYPSIKNCVEKVMKDFTMKFNNDGVYEEKGKMGGIIHDFILEKRKDKEIRVCLDCLFVKRNKRCGNKYCQVNKENYKMLEELMKKNKKSFMDGLE